MHAGIAIPVPRAAEIAAHFDDAETVDAVLPEMCPRHQAGEAPTQHRDVDILADRCPIGRRRPWIGLIIIGVIIGDFQILVLTVRTHTAIPLLGIASLEGRQVEIDGVAHRLTLHDLLRSSSSQPAEIGGFEGSLSPSSSTT